MQYGERVTRKSVVLHDYEQYGQPDGDLQMDYNFWVLAAETGAEVIPGHDGRVRDKHPALSGPASHIATVLG